MFDSNLTMERQVSSVTKSCFYHMRDLRRLSQFFLRDTVIKLANALVSSRLDYCNSLFHGISAKQVRRLQSIQNTLCRIIFCRNRFSSVSPLLKELHWLPVKHRISYKICLLTYKAMKTGLPAYLSCFINPYTSVKNTRLSADSKLVLDTPFVAPKIH